MNAYVCLYIHAQINAHVLWMRMSVFTYVHRLMHVCVHRGLPKHIDAHLHTHTHTYIHTYIHPATNLPKPYWFPRLIHTCSHTRTYIHTYNARHPTYMLTKTHTYTYIYIYTPSDTYMCTHIHIRTCTGLSRDELTKAMLVPAPDKCTYTHTYIHIHTHTYMHRLVSRRAYQSHVGTRAR